ncbi:MAG TPA: hypothetical protein VN201_12410 [Roseateles sp.]|nr:hypothetical protein [Roseateles sp.]
MALLGLLLGKFLAYCAFFLWAPRLLRIAPNDPGRFALRWAAMRLALGLLAIVPAFVTAFALGRVGLSSGVAFYAGVFGMRALIWASMAAAICRRHGAARSVRWAGWIGVGLLVNLIFDLLAQAAGADDFKYFC